MTNTDPSTMHALPSHWHHNQSYGRNCQASFTRLHAHVQNRANLIAMPARTVYTMHSKFVIAMILCTRATFAVDEPAAIEHSPPLDRFSAHSPATLMQLASEFAAPQRLRRFDSPESSTRLQPAPGSRPGISHICELVSQGHAARWHLVPCEYSRRS